MNEMQARVVRMDQLIQGLPIVHRREGAAWLLGDAHVCTSILWRTMEEVGLLSERGPRCLHPQL